MAIHALRRRDPGRGLPEALTAARRRPKIQFAQIPGQSTPRLVQPRDNPDNARVRAAGQSMLLFALGINHRTAPVHIREKVNFDPARLEDALRDLTSLPEVSEGLIVSTCNRTELY